MKRLRLFVPLFFFITVVFGASIHMSITPTPVLEVPPDKPVSYLANISTSSLLLGECRIDRAIVFFNTDSIDVELAYRIRLASAELPLTPRHEDLTPRTTPGLSETYAPFAPPGAPVASGIYLRRLTADDNHVIKKAILLK